MGKQHTPLVSIVVPIYNVEQYLEECFKSIRSQSYENIEIILVDDGATDSSGRIADKLAKSSKVTQVIHKKNGGLSDARNVGMKKAKGEFITFVDSDDCIDKNFVKNLMDAILSNDADIAQCDNSRKIEDLGRGAGGVKVLSGKSAFIELMKYKLISPTAWGKLYRVSIFRDNKLEFPVGRIHEDTAILYKLIYFAERVACLDQVLYYYRMNENSIMTAGYTEKHYSSVMKYHEELDEFIAQNSITINSRIMCKHKALRLLSILNKLALHRQDAQEGYFRIRKVYMECIFRAESIVCLVGILPAHLPVLFRLMRSLTPTLRKFAGKV